MNVTNRNASIPFMCDASQAFSPMLFTSPEMFLCGIPVIVDRFGITRFLDCDAILITDDRDRAVYLVNPYAKQCIVEYVSEQTGVE